MGTTALSGEYESIEHALHRLMWTEQKKFTLVLEEHGLTVPQFFVLFSLQRRTAGCAIGKLAEEMFQSHPTMTGIIDRLEQARLVVRDRVNADDRRQVVVSLTPLGRHLLDRALDARAARMQHALAAFSATDRRDFHRLLTVYLMTLEKDTE